MEDLEKIFGFGKQAKNKYFIAEKSFLENISISLGR